MKRIFILIFCLILFVGCCDNIEVIDNTEEKNTDKYEENRELKGVWVAIYEIAPKKKNKAEYAKQVENMMKNISGFGFTDIFVQVRANCDSIYPSKIFSPCYMYSNNGELLFDALDIIIKAAHKNSLKLHAWINPYRVSSDCEKKPLNIPEGMKKTDLFRTGKACYLNPCNERTNKVILDGIREIIENYDVDGIHIDDYFYPSQNNTIDKKEYGSYKESGGKCSLSEYRRNTVSLLVSSIYSLIKSKDERILFSISPSADIEKNRNVLYADVEKWCSESGYCDMIIPQIYFGFENESMPFKETFEEWKSLADKSKVRLSIGLAIYKSGKEDRYAGENGKNEWMENRDIIRREIEYIRKNKADGFAVFSYNYIFGNRNFTNEEVQNLKNVI